jgi:hypothetical protein
MAFRRMNGLGRLPEFPFVLSEVEARCATPFDFAQDERFSYSAVV